MERTPRTSIVSSFPADKNSSLDPSHQSKNNQGRKMQSRNFYLSFMLLATTLVATPSSANQPTYADCMKNPFASGCRGISAKRSQLEPLIGEPRPAGMWGSELGFTWPRSRQLNYRLANLLARPSAEPSRYEQEPATIELYQIFNEPPLMRPAVKVD